MQVTILCQFPNINGGMNYKMFLLSLYPQAHQLAIFTYSMKLVAFACNQDLASLGFFPYAILFSQSQINNPDPQMFFFIKKTLWPFSWMGFNCFPLREESKQSQALVARKCNSFHAVCKYSQLVGLGVQPQQQHYAIYTPIYVWKQYFQLLN